MMIKTSSQFPKKRIDSTSLMLQIDKDVSSLEEQLEKKKVSVESFLGTFPAACCGVIHYFRILFFLVIFIFESY